MLAASSGVYGGWGADDYADDGFLVALGAQLSTAPGDAEPVGAIFTGELCSQHFLA